MDQPLAMQVLDAFGDLQSHFYDFLGGERPDRALAAELAAQQEPLHVLVAGVRVQKEGRAAFFHRGPDHWEQSRVT